MLEKLLQIHMWYIDDAHQYWHRMAQSTTLSSFSAYRVDILTAEFQNDIFESFKMSSNAMTQCFHFHYDILCRDKKHVVCGSTDDNIIYNTQNSTIYELMNDTFILTIYKQWYIKKIYQSQVASEPSISPPLFAEHGCKNHVLFWRIFWRSRLLVTSTGDKAICVDKKIENIYSVVFQSCYIWQTQPAETRLQDGEAWQLLVGSVSLALYIELHLYIIINYWCVYLSLLYYIQWGYIIMLL